MLVLKAKNGDNLTFKINNQEIKILLKKEKGNYYLVIDAPKEIVILRDKATNEDSKPN